MVGACFATVLDEGHWWSLPPLVGLVARYLALVAVKGGGGHGQTVDAVGMGVMQRHEWLILSDRDGVVTTPVSAGFSLDPAVKDAQFFFIVMWQPSQERVLDSNLRISADRRVPSSIHSFGRTSEAPLCD